jgi:hypothetical protein
VGVLVVACDFMSECSCRVDPLVKVGEEKGEIITIREGLRRKGRWRNIIPLPKSFPV